MAIDRFGALGDKGIDPFKKIDRITGTIEDPDETRWLRTIIFSSYILEMYVVYAHGRKRLFIDTEYWSNVEGQKVSHSDRLLFSKLYNTFNDIHVHRVPKIDPLADLILPIIYEQMELQDKYMSSFVRFHKIYAINEEINEIFEERKGLSLKKSIILSWVLFTFLSKDEKMSGTIDKNSFIDFCKSIDVSSEEIESFFNLIALRREVFRKRYFSLRQTPDGSWYGWEQREAFDRGLPKVSYFYPMIDNENGTYTLVSYTAYKEYLKLRGFYRTMTEEFADIEFKSRYAGPLFEDYVRDLFFRYDRENDLDGFIGGNEKYKVGKNEYDEPDIVFKTDDYILCIECKSTPFSLGLLKEREPTHLERMKDDVSKSEKNIERFVKCRLTETERAKKIVKILVYYDIPHLVMASLVKEVRTAVTMSDFYIMDIESLEMLSMTCGQPIPKVLEDYLKDYHKTHQDINTFLRSSYEFDAYDEEANAIIKDLVVKELCLPTTEEKETT
ncbi:hypothetical protein [Hydrogenimonas urashimensis]|uniref:hypothetical protein n=1 Tax=Hydrogenimonas urashimensis TaxID=2740515 RepID=UPI0019156575|nr:hypothetical protein [Hydrogenimonas urashimensis]